jgi:hypothetical protein
VTYFDNVLVSDNHIETAEFSVAGQREAWRFTAQYIEGDPSISDGVRQICRLLT